MDENKVINISGINNRYQIKKLINENKQKKERVLFNNNNIDENNLTYSNQLESLKIIKNNFILSDKTLNKDFNIKILMRELEKKISSYKQQDIEKKIYCGEKFITINHIIDKLVECEMKCYYCNCEMSILYDISREMKQWSVDRVDNDKGHNNDNFHLACLDCNLKRRRITDDKFLFTKQLNIIRQDN